MELILFAVEAVIFIVVVLFLLALIDGNVEREEDKKLYETNREEWERRRQRQEQVMAESRAREIEKANNITCPHCGCSHYTVMKRGWKVTTGFLGSSKVIRVCDNCMKKF